MHDCQGTADVVVRIRIPVVRAQFNSNYKSGIEVLEDEAVEEIVQLLPQDYKVEVEDVVISDYELKDAEREYEND
jgi:uncharacterized protein YeeX (DUF496 family)